MGTHDTEACINLQPIPANQSAKPRILLADDDVEMRALLSLVLQNEDYEVIECVDGADLVDRLHALWIPGAPRRVDLLICDMQMPGMTGLDVLERMGRLPGFPPMILITAFGDDRLHNRARELGATASLDKPFDLDQLLEWVHRALALPPLRDGGKTP
jgi:CheY-like chemotaxis protein